MQIEVLQLCISKNNEKISKEIPKLQTPQRKSKIKIATTYKI